MMIDDHTILLKQILDELKQQDQYLFDIRVRMESLESAVGSGKSERANITDGTGTGEE